MNVEVKRHLISAGQTFVAVFGVTFFTLLGNTDITLLSKEAVGALIVAAVRTAIKMAWERYFTE